VIGSGKIVYDRLLPFVWRLLDTGRGGSRPGGVFGSGEQILRIFRLFDRARGELVNVSKTEDNK
jgi:hypothetical protein